MKLVSAYLTESSTRGSEEAERAFFGCRRTPVSIRVLFFFDVIRPLKLDSLGEEDAELRHRLSPSPESERPPARDVGLREPE